MSDSIYDLVIVGAGPIGLACAIEAKKAGLNYIVIEKGVLVNSIYHFPTNMTFFSTSQLLEIGDVPFIAHGDKPTRREALEYFRRVLDSWKLNVRLYELVNGLQNYENGYTVSTIKSIYRSKYVIISTGFYGLPNLMNIPGEELPKVKHYYDEPHPYINQDVIVIGAGNSAVDVALETYLKGSRVTMVVRESNFKEGIKYWIRPNIENRIKEGSIKAYFNSTITAIRETEVDIRTPKGSLILRNDFVLAMTGYRPDYSLFKIFGIEIGDLPDKAPKHNPATLETNKAGIYVAGVILGGLNTSRWFIENAREHAMAIINDIISKQKKRA